MSGANGQPPRYPPEPQPAEYLSADERELLAQYRLLRKSERQSKLVVEFDRDGFWRMYKYVPVARCL